MKNSRLLILLIIIFAGFAAIWLFPSVIRAQIPKSSGLTLKKISYCVQVSANGEICSDGAGAVKAQSSYVVGDALVKEGDRIEIGQAVASIDKAQTINKITSAIAVSSPGLSQSIAEASFAGTIPEAVYAESEGVVSEVCVKPGDYVESGDTIIRLDSGEKYIASLAVSESNMPGIEVGQKVTLSGNAFGKKKYTGTVISIGNSARKTYSGTTQKTVVDVVCSIDSPDDSIKPGYTVKGKIDTSGVKIASIVPYEAVSQDEKGEYVYVYESGRAYKRYIETGEELANGVEILSGLSETEEIIADPSVIRADGSIVIIERGDELA